MSNDFATYEQEYDVLKFEHPVTMVVAGPSQSGKTHFVSELLRARMLEPFPVNIHWFYGEMQEVYNQLSNEVYGLEYHKGLPPGEDFDIYTDSGENTLIIIDDLMQEALNSNEVANLYTKVSSHRNVSVILLSQNLFFQGKKQRTVALNAHATVIFPNERDKTQINTFAAQYAPRKIANFLEIFEDATSRKHGYLVVVTKPGTSRDYQLRTNIFPKELPSFFYSFK